jgi:hypothetical protein
MGKLFERAINPAWAHLLVPAAFGAPSQEQAAELEKWGFIPLYSRGNGDALERLGGVIARTRADGGLWAYARAAPTGDYARWAMRPDVELIASLMALLTHGGRLRSDGVVRELEKLFAVSNRFDDSTLAALDTVVRMGDAVAVMAYLGTL